jgi:hypothetical protein
VLGRAHPADHRIALSATDEHTYRPVDFDSLDGLLKVFKAALPAFDVSRFPREKQPVSSILFADVIELREKQRSVLGLKK